jgi:hypothetical protein
VSTRSVLHVGANSKVRELGLCTPFTRCAKAPLAYVHQLFLTTPA